MANLSEYSQQLANAHIEYAANPFATGTVCGTDCGTVDRTDPTPPGPTSSPPSDSPVAPTRVVTTSESPATLYIAPAPPTIPPYTGPNAFLPSAPKQEYNDPLWREQQRTHGKKGGRPKKYKQPEGMTDEDYKAYSRKMTMMEQRAKKLKEQILAGVVHLPVDRLAVTPAPIIDEPELLRRWEVFRDASEQYNAEVVALRSWLEHKEIQLATLHQQYFEYVHVLTAKGWAPVNQLQIHNPSKKSALNKKS